ncbi:hypothetical protein C8Q78DRAFT_1080406 [Trametes maxima]|nr:hypothetical protein C8Q78DRAFT_1080406 [Trametes maxima]
MSAEARGMHVCSDWNDFMSCYMPFVPREETVDEAVRLLKAKNLLRDDRDSDSDASSGWVWAKNGPDSGRERYGFLTEVSATLRGLQTFKSRTASCELVHFPDRRRDAVLSQNLKPGANVKIDAVFALLRGCTHGSRPEADPTFDDAAVTASYGVHSSHEDALENRKQLVSGVAYTIRVDPRRKHMFSISIEDTMMTVWYFSRSHSCMSASFDLGTNNRRCIQVFIAFIFASKSELGYDETVQILEHDGKSYYGYAVGDRLYRSTRCIFEHDGTRIIGRGTRVWEVVRVEDFESLKQIGEKHYALKDVWIDEDALTELAIQHALFADIDAVAKRIEESDFETLPLLDNIDERTREELRCCVADRQLYSQYFLTIDHDWRGPLSKPLAPSAVPSELASSADSLGDPTRLKSTLPASAPTAVRPQAVCTAFPPKYQYRVVFSEVGTALHDVDDISIVLRAARHCVFALQLLFLAGWVHRDISTGNLMWYNDRGLLADLEYARKFDPAARSRADSKTGTAFFMAVEIQKQLMLYSRPSNSRTRSDARAALFGTGSDPEMTWRAPPVIHNFQHDLESMFWVLLWTYLVRLPHPWLPSPEGVPVAQPDNNDRAQVPDVPSFLSVGISAPRNASTPVNERAIIQALFQNTPEYVLQRERVLANGGELFDIISPIFLGECVHIARTFHYLAITLHSFYMEREFDVANRTTYVGLYDEFRMAIGILERHCRERVDLYAPLTIPESRLAMVARRNARLPMRAGVGRDARPPQKHAHSEDDYYEEDKRSSKMPKR